MSTLPARTLFVSGGSRGIGLAIALRAARDGANVASRPRPRSRIRSCPARSTAPRGSIEQAGGKALPVMCDIRDEAAVQAAVAAGVARFGGIDILVNNASAISLTGTLATPMKRFDLMFGVNVRGTFVCAQACLPHLVAAAKTGRNPHILTLSPPLNMDAKWFAPHVAYTMAKYGMSMCVLGMAEEFRGAASAVNALWPRTVIATAAIAMIPGASRAARLTCASRRSWPTPRMRSSCATRARRPATSSSTRTCCARPASRTSRRYAVKPGAPLMPDLFL